MCPHRKCKWFSCFFINALVVFSLVGYSDAFSEFRMLPRHSDSLEKHFSNPPAEYGMVPFFWWTGEPLSRQRIIWELDQLKANGFSGVNVNYTHTNLGYSYKGDPPLFSEGWWKFWQDIVDECAKRDMAIGFDDYLVTHGNPELAIVGSRIRQEAPEVAGLLLRQRVYTLEHGSAFSLHEVKDSNVVASTAYRVGREKLDPSSAVDLRALAEADSRLWEVPDGTWYVSILYTRTQPFGALNPLYAQKVIEQYFEGFKRHSKGLMGKAVNYFFQDELTFGGSMPYWSPNLPREFKKLKGYDLLPELTALFRDIGPRTPKIRLDYYDVATRLMEDAYFRPIFDWCQKHNIVYGHDQLGRADVVHSVEHYGDYFRTMRWYQAPGTDRLPELYRGKVCASVAQLYDRPRTWFEAYHSTGWGVTPEDLHRWDCEALIYGYNLICYHSLYYTTRAGWWAWAPGDTHWRQPYWRYMREYYKQVQRLCFLLSQGKHQCDVAVLFPTSTVQADMNGTRAGKSAAECKKLLSVMSPLFKEHAVDFDYVDHESVSSASVRNGLLEVAGGSWRVLVMPGIRAIHEKTLDKVLELYRKGGIVVALGALPEAGDRMGREDPLLDSKVKEVFGITACDVASRVLDSVHVHKNAAGGMGCLLRTPDCTNLSGQQSGEGDTPLLANNLADLICRSIERDFVCQGPAVYVMHRRIGMRDVYAMYNPTGQTITPRLFFRVVGKRLEHWDAWTGYVKPIHSYQTCDSHVEMDLSFEPHELKVVVFSPGKDKPRTAAADNVAEPVESIVLDGLWDFTIEPVLDNRWGDFRSPAGSERIGPEARQFRYAEERPDTDTAKWQDPNFDDHRWPTTTASWGPRFWILGPVPRSADVATLEKALAELDHIDPGWNVQVGGLEFQWQPYEYSLRWGRQNDPLLTSQSGIAIHGPIGWVPDEFIHLQTASEADSWYLWTSLQSPVGRDTRLAVGTRAAFQTWLHGATVMTKYGAKAEIRAGPWRIRDYPLPGMQTKPVSLRRGNNPLLVKLTGAGQGTMVRAFVVLGDKFKDTAEPNLYKIPSGNANYVPDGLVASQWYTKARPAEFDPNPQNRPRGLWYRFTTPPGLASLTMVVHGKPQLWVDGRRFELQRATDVDSPAQTYEQADVYRATVKNPILISTSAAVRIEPRPGYYGGAAVPEPIRFTCRKGQAPLGDWSALGLATYSGTARYGKDVTLTAGHVNANVLLDLTDVAAAAEVLVNGRKADTLLRRPWRVDISRLVQPGKNRIETLVANTLANHYSAGMPCGNRYINPGQLRAGLMGPVQVEIQPNTEPKAGLTLLKDASLLHVDVDHR
ncbi:MAG TPA: glycosyl hydrolase [Sedimentisphaerales bacterium]|nr:glycosyl hydrolase [Sedimentisphaerales bacterium]